MPFRKESFFSILISAVDGLFHRGYAALPAGVLLLPALFHPGHYPIRIERLVAKIAGAQLGEYEPYTSISLAK